MADILIKGLEIPTMTETFKQAERVPYIDVRIFADGTAVTSKCERPYYTQYSAVPVPPHGRLIDADEFAEQNEDSWNEEVYHPLYALTLCELIEAAPTVIEASGDGEHG